MTILNDELAPAGDDGAEAPAPIRAVERVCDIFDLLQNAPEGLSLTTIVEKTGLPKSTTHRYLASLEARHYVERHPDTGILRLGLAFRPTPNRRVDQLVSASRPALTRLRDLSDETANLGLLDGGQYVHAVVIESSHQIRLAARVGERGMIHSTAIGKVVASQLAEDRVIAILRAEGMPRLTDRTITDPGEYLHELKKVRRLGHALDDGEHQEGGRCIAVPIPGLSTGAISLSAPLARFPKTRTPEFAAMLREAANDLAATFRSLPG
jgi:IclR family acetate operon transcriptional repressor